jgi:V/A-type H+-transporting ATPase subunit I
MKEILLFSSARSVDETIMRIGELGVVDVKEIKRPDNESISKRKIDVEHAKKAISMLTDYALKENKVVHRNKYVAQDPHQLIDRVLQTEQIRKNCRERLQVLKQQIEWYLTWGEKVDINEISYLRERGIYLRLYLLEKSVASSINHKHLVVKLSERNNLVPVVLIARNESERLSQKEEELPTLPYDDVVLRFRRKERQLIEVDRFMIDHAENVSWLEDYALFLKDQLEQEIVWEGMGDIEGRVKYLKGYIPNNAVEDFTAAAESHHWGYQIAEPKRLEEVPVYIKNPKWIDIINPVMKFIDIVPGYEEVDVSIYFLLAFALFFAMLVGDAGYGLIFLLISFLFRNKLAPQLKTLIYVLSTATIVWGVLSGTYFGSEQIAALPFLNDLMIRDIASFGVDNISFMMHLSFLIGAIHLTVAHGIRMFQFSNSIKAFSEVGWILLVWGLFLITEQLVLGKLMPDWGVWLFAGGAVLVALFSVESKSFIKSMGISLANLPLSLISGFSDIVSYVRLFAVGMATAAVAASFNNMILPHGTTGMGMLNLFMAAIGLLLGHGLNIVLALMAVMVHGIRLNMLEFAGHLGVQFSGEAYRPFKLVSTRDGFDNKSATSIQNV